MYKSLRLVSVFIIYNYITFASAQGVLPTAIPEAINRLFSEGQQGFENIKGKQTDDDEYSKGFESTFKILGGDDPMITFYKEDRSTEWSQILYGDPDSERCRLKFQQYSKEFMRIFKNSFEQKQSFKTTKGNEHITYFYEGHSKDVKIRLEFSNGHYFNSNNRNVWMIELKATWERD